MSYHRVVVVAVATLFSIGMTSIASAGWGWGYSSPLAYAAAGPVGYGGYGGCGACGTPAVTAVYAAPVGYGCGVCGTPTAAVVYAEPVAPAVPAPIVVAPVAPTAFGGPCCGWNGCGSCGGSDWSGGCGVCGQPVAYAAPSLYVVNQGPVYSGPGIMTPYRTYSPETAYAAATDYPYVPGSGYGYGYGAAPPYPPYYAHRSYRPRYAYRTPMAMHPYMHPYAHAYMHPRYYGAGPRVYRGAPHWRRYP